MGAFYVVHLSYIAKAVSASLLHVWFAVGG